MVKKKPSRFRKACIYFKIKLLSLPYLEMFLSVFYCFYNCHEPGENSNKCPTIQNITSKKNGILHKRVR